MAFTGTATTIFAYTNPRLRKVVKFTLQGYLNNSLIDTYTVYTEVEMQNKFGQMQKLSDSPTHTYDQIIVKQYSVDIPSASPDT